MGLGGAEDRDPHARRHAQADGRAYKAAATRARAPRAFRPFLKRRSLEGFLFPSLYEFTQHTPASDAGRNYLYYLRRPGTVRHFFTASEEEFCAKAREWSYTEDC
ncbi:MAG: hypothetical protein ACRDMK_04865 [Gaiellaceae bacterium]